MSRIKIKETLETYEYYTMFQGLKGRKREMNYARSK